MLAKHMPQAQAQALTMPPGRDVGGK